MTETRALVTTIQVSSLRPQAKPSAGRHKLTGSLCAFLLSQTYRNDTDKDMSEILFNQDELDIRSFERLEATVKLGKTKNFVEHVASAKADKSPKKLEFTVNQDKKQVNPTALTMNCPTLS